MRTHSNLSRDLHVHQNVCVYYPHDTLFAPAFFCRSSLVPAAINSITSPTWPYQRAIIRADMPFCKVYACVCVYMNVYSWIDLLDMYYDVCFCVCWF